MTDLNRLPRPVLEQMANAGRMARASMDALAQCGSSVVSEALKDADGFFEWRHYPETDVYDPVSHAQFYYHAHPPGERAAVEHGHFHTFLRPRGMPPGVRPLVLPELAIADAPAQPATPVLPPAAQPNQGEDNDKPSHLVAIAMDSHGRPIRLFTTNRWVTGETWYAAADAVRMLDRFRVDVPGPAPLVSRWITAMFILFRPEMAELLIARDAGIMSWRRRHRGKVHVFEDRRLDVAASIDIDLDAHLSRVEAAFRRAA
ncbi:MAG TPA: hypothetical protein VLX09_09860 [Stellaceae bacterium]|nr:hypothetical protein [Stellaceae bacterium]